MVKQYFKQSHRGREGFGLFDYEYKNMVHETKEQNILKWLKRYPSNNLLFHHRFPTSTENVKNACHPFSTKDFFKTNYVLVHNGIIYNDYELKAEHEALGIKYQSEQSNGTFNDSEALLWDVALYLEGKQDSLKAEGAIAFICLALGKGNKHDRMWFARNSSPLNMVLDETGLMLSSEGAGEPIDENTLYSFDYVNHKLDVKPLTVPRWVSNANNYNNYQWSAPVDEDEDFTPKAYDYNKAASAKVGKSLIRYTKQTDYAKNLDVSVVLRRIVEMTSNTWEAIEQVDYEYDCVALYYDQLSAKNQKLDEALYTLSVYQEVVFELEISEQVNETKQQQLIEGQAA